MAKHDQRINWKQKYSKLEQNKAAADQKTFEDCFDDAIKLSEQDEVIEQLKQKIQSQEIPIKDTTPISPDNNERYKNAFIHNGEAWEIWFQGTKLKPIKEMDGMTYIASLLKNPGKPMHVTDLCAYASRRRDEAMMANEDLADSLKNGDMSISTMQEDGLDDLAKDELQEKIKDLDEIINN